MRNKFTTWATEKPHIAFFLLAFVFTWVIWLPVIKPLQGLMTFDVPIWALLMLLLGAAGPSIAALVITYLSGGGAAVRGLLRDYRKWRVGTWYAIVILIPIIFFFGTLLIAWGAGIATPTLAEPFGPQLIVTLIIAYIVRFLIALPSGPFLEELGWRGFALPQLQGRTSALNASIIIGIAWGLWHLPMFFVPGAALPGGATLLTNPLTVIPYVINTIGLSIIFTWAYNSTRGSLLLDILFHAAINTTFNVFVPIFYPEASTALIRSLGLIQLALTWIMASALIAIYGRERLSSGEKLDFSHVYQQQSPELHPEVQPS